MTHDYTETEILEVLNDLVASGEVIKKGDGYYVPENRKELPATTAEQSSAIEELILAFDFAPGDFMSMTFFEDGVEVRANRVGW